MKKSHRTTIPILCVLICALMLCPTGCRQQASSDNGKQTREELDSLRQSFRYFNVEGQYDSIISTARPILMKALDGQDTMTVLLTGAYTAQAFLTMESMDSVRHYMNLIGPYRKGGGKDPSLQTTTPLPSNPSQKDASGRRQATTLTTISYCWPTSRTYST